MLRDRELLDDHGKLRSDSDALFPDSIQALIAARLDTLAPERKQLLQDAAVVGKVFWAGALVSIGERDPNDVAVALHELARKELVRPSRQSSMEGEAEYGFWHALVRDVAYQQIPRADRAERHLATAAWIEETASDRVEDLADVLAFHTWEALELLQAAGEAGRVGEVARAACRFASLAAERASGLDPEKALHQLDRALLLTTSDEQEAVALLQWGRAAREVGRGLEAIDRLVRAVELARASGSIATMSDALVALSFLEREQGVATWKQHAEEAASALDAYPHDASRVDALAHLAVARMLEGEFNEAIESSEQALALASELGLAPPARALSARGAARCSLGDRGGLEDGRAAIEQSIARGAAGEATRNINNFAIDTYLFDGPGAALTVLETGSSYAAQCGLVQASIAIDETRVAFLLLAGRVGEAIAASESAISGFESTGDLVSRADALVYRTFALAERGDVRRDDAEQALLDCRQLGQADALLAGLAINAHACVASGVPHLADGYLEELVSLDDIAWCVNLAELYVPAVRSALGADRVDLAEALSARVDPALPVYRCCLRSSDALLAEARGDHRAASVAFADAASGWADFGGTFERAYALLGAGRNLAALYDTAADGILRDARALFSDMGLRPRIDECDALIAREQAELLARQVEPEASRQRRDHPGR